MAVTAAVATCGFGAPCRRLSGAFGRNFRAIDIEIVGEWWMFYGRNGGNMLECGIPVEFVG